MSGLRPYTSPMRTRCVSNRVRLVKALAGLVSPKLSGQGVSSCGVQYGHLNMRGVSDSLYGW
jgi:hypothetical protein